MSKQARYFSLMYLNRSEHITPADAARRDKDETKTRQRRDKDETDVRSRKQTEEAGYRLTVANIWSVALTKVQLKLTEMFLQIHDNPSNSCSKSDLLIATIKVNLSAQLILWEPRTSVQNSILIHPVAVEIFLELSGRLIHIFKGNISIMMLLENWTPKNQDHHPTGLICVHLYLQHRAEMQFSTRCVKNKKFHFCLFFCFIFVSEPRLSPVSVTATHNRGLISSYQRDSLGPISCLFNQLSEVFPPLCCDLSPAVCRSLSYAVISVSLFSFPLE